VVWRGQLARKSKADLEDRSQSAASATELAAGKELRAKARKSVSEGGCGK
jgi:hypothetical protein